MTKYNSNNERIKREYRVFLKEAHRKSEEAIDGFDDAVARFEAFTRHRDFRCFHREQAIAFKKHLIDQTNRRTGARLSKATCHAVVGHLKRFVFWLAGQPGYRPRIAYSDAAYFNLSEKDTRIATARRETAYPSLDEIRSVLARMPTGTEVEKRDRALIAFTILTGARDRAIASFKLKHIDLEAGRIDQDAREVQTKNSKTFSTDFFPVDDEIRQIVGEWVQFLRQGKGWGADDPLFPSTETLLRADGGRPLRGLKRQHWRTADPIRAIFKSAFAAAGLRYFNPHSFRNTLVALGQSLCQTPEQYKAWSQNLGHDEVMTTLTSYGAVRPARQAELMHELRRRRANATWDPDVVELARQLHDRLVKVC